MHGLWREGEWERGGRGEEVGGRGEEEERKRGGRGEGGEREGETHKERQADMACARQEGGGGGGPDAFSPVTARACAPTNMTHAYIHTHPHLHAHAYTGADETKQRVRVSPGSPHGMYVCMHAFTCVCVRARVFEYVCVYVYMCEYLYVCV